MGLIRLFAEARHLDGQDTVLLRQQVQGTAVAKAACPVQDDECVAGAGSASTGRRSPGLDGVLSESGAGACCAVAGMRDVVMWSPLCACRA